MIAVQIDDRRVGQIQGGPPALDLECRHQQGLPPAVDAPLDHACDPAMRVGLALPAPGFRDRERAHPFAGTRMLPVHCRTQGFGLRQHLGWIGLAWVPLDQEVDPLALGTHAVLQRIVAAVQAQQQRRRGQCPRRRQYPIEHKAEPQLAVLAAGLQFGGQAPAFLPQIGRHHPITVEALVGVAHAFLARPRVVLRKQVHVQRDMPRRQRRDRYLHALQKGLVRAVEGARIVHREGIHALAQTCRRNAPLEPQRRQEVRIGTRALGRFQVALAQRQQPEVGGQHLGMAGTPDIARGSPLLLPVVPPGSPRPTAQARRWR